MKVMIADDNEQNLYLLEVLLRSEKYEVVCAKDGLEALEYLKKDSFGLIISDILMPRMDGFQLCRECKVDPHLKDIPFIFYTATYTDGKDEEFASSLGADRFIVKPIEPQVLLATIREVIKEYEKGSPLKKQSLIKDEELYLVEYNKRLIQKLEKKMLDLEAAHKTLAESENKYRTLVTQSPDGIFIVDLQGTFLAVNKAMCERLKYSEEGFLSMKIWDIVPEKYADLHKKRLADILRGEAPNEAAEYVVRGKDEKMHYIEILSSPYFRENEVIGFQGIARDITERKRAEEALKKSEERFRLAAESSSDLIYEW
ncbi:MAG: PAS domain S-box protein, partial [Deltaproteobacteria bacterium]|nr:PAS domain S-box protein [Deltaproteobacteria bacterium]